MAEATCERDLMAIGKRRWRRAQFLADAFWKMWRENYLQELTCRRKWRRDKAQLNENDVVLLREKNLPRCDWRTGRVSRLVRGTDGRVRRAGVTLINTKGHRKETERAVTDLILLVSAAEDRETDSLAPPSVSSTGD